MVIIILDHRIGFVTDYYFLHWRLLTIDIEPSRRFGDKKSIVLQLEDAQGFEETSRGYNPHSSKVTVSRIFRLLQVAWVQLFVSN